MELRVTLLVTGYIAAASLVLLVLQLMSSNRGKFRSLWEMVGYEVLALIAVFLPAYVGSGAFALLVMVIVLMTQHEILRAGDESSLVYLHGAGALGGLSILAAAYWGGEKAMAGAASLSVIGLLTAALFIPLERKHLASVALTGLTLLYPALLMGYTILLRQLSDGFVWVVVLYGIIEIHDGFANLIGRIFGKHKVFGKLSPNKSFQGAAAGMLMTFTAIPLMKWYVLPDESLVELIGVVVLIDVFTVAGDLIDSKLKRLMGIKDSGNVIPYRGGFLDIYDALMLTSAPFYFYITTVIQ